MGSVVIIPTYNGARFISEALRSCFVQSSPPQEVIVVDNASTDGAQNIVRSKHEQTRLIQLERNLGFGQACNIGVQHALDAGAKYILLMNQDARAHPEMLEKLVRALEDNPAIGIMTPLHMTYDGTAIDQPFLRRRLHDAPDFVSDMYFGRLQPMYRIGFEAAAFWLVRREVFEQISGFDPLFFMYGEDDDFTTRAKKAGWEFGLATNAIGYHWHTDAQSDKSTERRVAAYYTKCVLQLKRIDHSFVRNLLRVTRQVTADGLYHGLLRKPDKAAVAWRAYRRLIARLPKIRQSRKACANGAAPFIEQRYTVDVERTPESTEHNESA